jgi:hypothetical protein
VARGNLYISFLDAGGVFSVDLAAIVAAFFGVPYYKGITTRMRSRQRDEYRAFNSATGAKRGQKYSDLVPKLRP